MSAQDAAQGTAQDTAQLIRSYLASLGAKDAERCADYFADDAVIYFTMGVYTGRPAIVDWHRERFEAGMTVLQIDKVVAQGSQVSCEIVIESKRLKAWRIQRLRGKGVFKLQDGKINDARFSLAGGNPLESWQ